MALQQIVRIESLNLSFNQFTKVPEAVTALRSLRVLEVTGCGLLSLPESTSNVAVVFPSEKIIIQKTYCEQVWAA